MKKDIKLAIGRTIKNRREQLEITSHDLVVSTGLSKSLISRLESGDVGMSLETLFRVSAALDCKPSDMLADIETQLKQV